MKRNLLLLLALAVLAATPATGQRATERFIPIGKSPGLSGKCTYMGKIATADLNGRVISGRSWTATLTDRTRIWLDRSKLGQSSVTGTPADLKAGATIEIKYVGLERGKRSGPAEWIKVEVAVPAK